MARKKARPLTCSRSSSSWPDLAPDIAGDVLGRLPSYADRICFGAVCRSWRSSARQHHARPLLPCLCFADGTFRGFPAEDRPFRLPGAAGHHSSCGEWLVLERDDGAYSLVDPFATDTTPAALLPSLSRVRVRHDPVVAVGERELPDCTNPWVPRESDTEPGHTAPVSLLKLVVCSARLVAAIIGQGRHGKLALCRPGAASWSVSGSEPWRRLKDMAYHQGKLYVVDQNEDLLAVTVADDEDELPTMSRLDRVVMGGPPDTDLRRRATLHYLVESAVDGALLMVRREIFRAPARERCIRWRDERDEDITVFEADFRSRTWEELGGALGGERALFVGRWCSRTVGVPAERRAEWADRVFFLEDGMGEEWPVRSMRYSLSVFMMKGGDFPPGGRIWKSESLLPLMVSKEGDDLPATWIFPQDNRTNWSASLSMVMRRRIPGAVHLTIIFYL